MTRLGVGIIGTGMIGQVHADAARRSGAHILGVSGSSLDSAKAAVASWAPESRAMDVEEMLADPQVSVVHLCVPNHLHEAFATQVLQAGKHVVCEKPLSVDLAGARRMTELAGSSALIAAVPFIYRYHPLVAEARSRTRAGSIGPVRLIHGSYLQDWLSDPAADNWRVDAARGGASRAFADIGSHWCDLVEWVSGHRLTEVQAMTQSVPRDRIAAGAAQDAIRTEDIACVNFRTDKGAVGTVVVSQVSPGRKNRLWFEISGTESGISFDQEQPESLWVGSRSGIQTVLRDPGFLSPEAAALPNLPPGHAQGYNDCFAAFVKDVYAAVKGRSEERMPTFTDGVRAASITDAVLTSARKNSWVDVQH